MREGSSYAQSSAAGGVGGICLSKCRGEHRHVRTDTMGTIKDEDPRVSWGVVSDSVGTPDGHAYIASKEGMDSSPGLLFILRWTLR